MTRSVELRSDTFTRPTPAMRRVMAEAEVGDDVWNEDPTVHRLEARAAALTGKDAAVFVSSGTQGNLLAMLAHTRRGDEIILGDQSHIFRYEAAGTAVCGGLQAHTIPNGTTGHLDPDLVVRAIRRKDEHEPRTGAIAVENTHNACGGAVLTLGEMEALAEIARDHDIPLHLDGARLFNASTALGISAATLARSMDSVTFCLSKGLGAPIGSVLCGSEAFVAQARRYRKMLGGGMRQVGILAAAGLFALDHHVDRLTEDHANARLLSQGLSQIPGIRLGPANVVTNMVFIRTEDISMTPAQFTLALAHHGVRMAPAGNGKVRAVTSLEVSEADIRFAVQSAAEVAQAAQPALA